MFFSTNRHQACATCKVSFYSAGVGVGGQKAALGIRGFLLAKRKSWALNPKAVDLAAWAPHLVSSLMRVPDFLLGTQPRPQLPGKQVSSASSGGSVIEFNPAGHGDGPRDGDRAIAERV